MKIKLEIMKNNILIVIAILCFASSKAQEAEQNAQEKIELQMPFYQNLAAAKQNGNWGFINNKKQWKIKPIYKDVSFFVKDYALVLKPDKTFAFINKNGKEFEIGDVASSDEGIFWYECTQNNIWFGCRGGGEIIKVN